MYQLILKDILLQKKRLLFFPLIYTIFVVTVLHNLSNTFVIASIVITYMMIQTAVVYEDMNNTEVVINSLPIKKAKIVLTRYLSVFVYLGISIASYLIVMGAINVLHLPFSVDSIAITNFFFALLGLSFIISSYLPIFFKYGYVKSKIFHIFFMMAAFFIPTLITTFIKTNPDSVIVEFVLNFLQTTPDLIMNFIVLLIAAAFMGISYFLSVNFYKNREF